MLEIGVVPVINENDTVATTEIKVGDNDRLAARVAQMISADTLIIFSDIKGLYTANPRKDPNAVLVPVVEKMTKEIDAMADGTHRISSVEEISAANDVIRREVAAFERPQ